MLPEIKERSAQENPLNEAANMQRQGMNSEQIANNLRQRNMDPNQISDTMSQATIKNEVSRMQVPLPPPQEAGAMPTTPGMGVMPPGTQMARQQLPPELMNAPAPTPSPIPPRTQGISQPTAAPTQPQMQKPMIPTFAPEPAERASYEMVEEIAESVVKEKWDELTRNVGDIRTWKEGMQVDMKAVKQEILRTQERFDSLQKAIMTKLTEYDSGVKEVGTDMKALEQVLQRILGPLSRNIKELDKVVQEIKSKKRKRAKK